MGTHQFYYSRVEGVLSRMKGANPMDFITPEQAKSDATKVYFGEADFEDDEDEV